MRRGSREIEGSGWEGGRGKGKEERVRRRKRRQRRGGGEDWGRHARNRQIARIQIETNPLMERGGGSDLCCCGLPLVKTRGDREGGEGEEREREGASGRERGDGHG